MDELRRVSCHRAMLRPNLLLGCERELILLAGLLAAVMTVVLFDIRSMILGIALWLTSLWVLQRMAKADPMLSKIYRRFVNFQPYYAARSTPFARVHRSHR